mgnify:CR=1 FL=1
MSGSLPGQLDSELSSRILDAVAAGFESQLGFTMDLMRQPSVRGQEESAQALSEARGGRERVKALTEIVKGYETGLAALRDGALRCSEQREFDGELIAIPYFALGDEKVWGATAMVLAELAALLE